MLMLLTWIPALLALVLLIYAVLALRKRHWGSASFRLFLSLALFVIAAASGLVSVATRGYQALIQETVAATVSIEPLSEQRYRAVFEFPDGRTETFELAGDALYVDAHILKWHSRANILGLRTMYELDRVAGRYDLLDDEQTQPRTVYSLAQPKPLELDMFTAVKRYPQLESLVDARYGSATFVPARESKRYAVLVSTTGLLAREMQ